MENLYLEVYELPPLSPLKEEDDVTTELEVCLKDHLAEWRYLVEV